MNPWCLGTWGSGSTDGFKTSALIQTLLREGFGPLLLFA